MNETLFNSVPLSSNCVLIEDASQLPELPLVIDELYCDFETSSGNPSLDSLNPWKPDHCRVCLAAFTWDDNPMVYCVPRELAERILPELTRRSRVWVNQNVKYDTHVLHNDLEISYGGELVDTLTFAKIIDSDRTYRGGYGLDVLAKEYLDVDLSSYYKSLKPWVGGDTKNQDYGKIPRPTLADYAGNQVQANRRLYKKQLELLPTECKTVWETEQELTKLLVNVERRGMKINLNGVRLSLLRSLDRMMRFNSELNLLVGYEVNPKSHDDCQDLLINRFGLPAIYNEKKGVKSKGPSFDKNVLKHYMQLPDAPQAILKLISDYRHEDTMQGTFWTAWLRLEVDGVLHSDYNQCVRSGRMSCSEPNSQQLNNEARSLVKPREGYALVVRDYSQIEYRLIVHYIDNPAAVKAYNENPDLDWYQYIADELGIERKPSKTLNLAIGFGMGKRKTIVSVSSNDAILKQTGGDRELAREIAIRAHSDYHRRLPELKPTSKEAEYAARRQGYVRNEYRRRCHIPLQFARVGFNRVVQSHAADHIKNRAIALSKVQKSYGVEMLAMVHDEILDEVPLEIAELYGHETNSLLNHSAVSIRVPIRCDMGISHENWFAAKENADVRKSLKQVASKIA